jgi:hypothetical protein
LSKKLDDYFESQSASDRFSHYIPRTPFEKEVERAQVDGLKYLTESAHVPIEEIKSIFPITLFFRENPEDNTQYCVMSRNAKNTEKQVTDYMPVFRALKFAESLRNCYRKNNLACNIQLKKKRKKK